MSVVIGAGIFNNAGSAIKVAGPGGALLAFATMSRLDNTTSESSTHDSVGVIAICVSECIGEMVQLFPIQNAIVEYVRKFIDEDLGWAVGIAYW
jgi:amino acid transporter